MRAGAVALSLLSAPLNVHALRALAGEPRSLIDLRRALGSPPQTTMRAHLRTLTELGVLERQHAEDCPGTVDYALARPAHDLLAVADVVQDWLTVSPHAPLALASPASKSAIKALVDGWSSSIVRAIAARPLSLTDLSRLISGFNYPSLERRLAAMRIAGQVEASERPTRGTPYAATDWLRRAAAPLLAAIRWERRHLGTQAPLLSRIDAEAVLLLAAPLLHPAADLSGVCRLAFQIRGGEGETHLAGVRVEVREGRVAACSSRLEDGFDAAASGSVSAVLEALIDADLSRMQIRGDHGLAQALIEAVHDGLFAIRQQV